MNTQPSSHWSLVLILLSAVGFASAIFKPAQAAGPPPGKIGIATDALPCLTVGPGSSQPSSGRLILQWRGQAEQARLILTVAGAEAAHTIKVNGQAVATTPLYAEGQLCGAGEVFYLDLPPTALKRGANTIELTNNARPDDTWSASQVRIEVLGAIEHEPGANAAESVQAAATTATLSTINFSNAYDGSTQQARVQVPAAYNGTTATPLVIVVHPRSSDMFYGENQGFQLAADSRGWFYAAPQLHGNWPGTSSTPIPNPPGKYAYASLQSQYDVAGTIRYLVTNYKIDPERIYLYGSSMGSQVGEVTVGKFPYLFAAAFFNKGPSDWGQWYQQTKNLIAQGYSQSFHKQWMERECYIMVNGTPTVQTPTQNPFCYQRRSGLNFARNYRHVPVAMTHSNNDLLVPLSHSTALRDSINSYASDRAATLTVDTVVGPTCNDGGSSDPTPYYHCLENDPNAVLTFLAPFTRQSAPANLSIATDQAKAYYWLLITPSGASHWSTVEATADRAQGTVTVTSNDPNRLTLGFNLGSTAQTEITPQPGLGLAATTYLVKESGQAAYLATYSGGYLTAALQGTGQVGLTIAALEVRVSANPASRPAGQPTQATITVIAKDRLGNPVPEQTPVMLSTTAGKFPNNATTFVGATTNGQFTVTLTLAATDGSAQVTATVGNTSGTTTLAVTNGSSQALYLSSTTSGTAGGINFGNEDILAYNLSTGGWSLFFDGSDVGLGSADVDAFSLQPDGSLILSLAQPFTVTGLGPVDDSDLIRFIPTSTGTKTTGSFAWYFDGSAVGLDQDGEDVDAFAILPDGRLLISTLGNSSVAGITGADEDLLAFTPTQLGATTSGTWALYFDGSDVGLSDSSEDLLSVWSDPATNELYLSTLGAYSVAGLSGDANDIFICTPGTLGATTSCTYRLFWDGAAHGFAGEVIDALDLAAPPVVSANEPATDTPEEQAVDIADSGQDDEGQDDAVQIFLPLVVQ